MNTSSLTTFSQHLLVSSGVLILTGFVFYGLLRRQPAAVRELLWRAVFMVLTLLPLVWFLKPWGMITEPPAEFPLARVGQFSAEMPGENPSSTLTVKSEPIPADGSTVNLPAVFLSIWAGGASLLLARAAGATVLRRRWLKSARECSGTGAEAAWRALSGPLEARLLVSATCPVPLTWGRIVILPEEALTWPEDQLRAALRHEMAHLRRRDSLFRRMGEFATALFWPQLLVWPARRLWHRMQEQACDDDVIRQGTDAATYSALLCHAARAWRRGLPGTLAMAQPSSLEKRIRAVLSPDGDRRLCSRWHVTTALAAGFLTFACAALAQKPDAPPPAKPAIPPAAADSAAKAKAMELVVPRVQFAEVDLDMAIAFVKAKSKDLDPDGKGISIKGPPVKPAKTISLELRNIKVWELLSVIAELTDTDLEAGPDGIVFVAGGDPRATPAAKAKAMKLVVPQVQFAEVDLDIAIAFVKTKSKELDPDGKGISIKGPPVKPAKTITLELRNVRVWELLSVIASFTDTHLVADPEGIAFVAGADPRATPALSARAKQIRIDKVVFKDVTVEEIVQYVRRKAMEFDPSKEGMNIVVKDAGPGKYSISMTNASVWEILKKVADLSGMSLGTSGDTRDGVDFETSIILDRSTKSPDEIGVPNSVALSPQFKSLSRVKVPGVKPGGTLAEAAAALAKDISQASSGKTRVTFKVAPAIANEKYEVELPPHTADMRFIMLTKMGKHEWALEGDTLLLRPKAPK